MSEELVRWFRRGNDRRGLPLRSLRSFSQSRNPAAIYSLTCTGTAIYLSEVLLVLAAEVISSGDAATAQQVAESGSPATGSGASIDELEYTVVARRTLGRRGAKAVDAFIFVQSFGTALSILIIMGSLTTSVLSEWTETETSSAFARLWYSFYFVLPVMVVLFVIPPSLIRHFSNVRCAACVSHGHFVSFSLVRRKLED